MVVRTPRSTRTDTLLPYTTLFRSRLRHVHAAILGLPRVQRRAADAVLATHIGGLHPAFLPAYHRDDLLLAEPGLPHVRVLTKSASRSNWQSSRGASKQRQTGIAHVGNPVINAQTVFHLLHEK